MIDMYLDYRLLVNLSQFVKIPFKYVLIIMKLFQLNMEACEGRVYWKFHHHDKDSQLHEIKDFRKWISLEMEEQ